MRIHRSIQRRGESTPTWIFPSMLVLVATVAMLGAWPTFAVTEMTDLYEAEVPVEGQDADQRNEAIVEAFRRMLVKVTGNHRVGSREDLQQAVQGASRYVQQYRYAFLPADPTMATGTPGAGTQGGAGPVSGAAEQRILRVRFDAQAVNRMLRGQGLPVWGSSRPATLLWLGVEEKSGRAFYFPDRDPQLRVVIEKVADERGLQLMLPLMDLEDQSALKISDLWGAFEPNIRAASERYVPDMILAGRVEGGSRTQWRGSWSLLRPDGRSVDWQSQGGTKEQAVALGIHGAMDILASQYAPIVADSSQTDLQIRISGVDSLERYALVTDYLKSLDPVDNVVLDVIETGVAGFSLQVRGGPHVLERVVALGGVLEQETVETPAALPAAGTGPETAIVPTLHFRLRQ